MLEWLSKILQWLLGGSRVSHTLISRRLEIPLQVVVVPVRIDTPPVVDPYMLLDSDTPVSIATRLYLGTPTPRVFVDAVYAFVQKNIRFESIHGNLKIRSPARTLQDRVGDCSEYALLCIEMLTSRGVDARYVWGYTTSGVLHATVEVHLDHQVWFIDQAGLPGFIKAGDGLYPGEHVVG